MSAWAWYARVLASYNGGPVPWPDDAKGGAMRLEERFAAPVEVPETGDAAERQVRLAVVCYGGVSLAVYMHGITKEIHKLVLASRACERGDPPPQDPTQRIYYELLERLRQHDGLRRRVVVDVISGSSAGGINGIYLAKALACDESQDELRDLWLERGSLWRLLGGRGLMPLLTVPWWLAAGVAAPLGARAASFVLSKLTRNRVRLPVPPTATPFKGRLIIRWLHDALVGMDRNRPDDAAPVLPEGHPLELYVTATDFHGRDHELWLEHPRHVTDRMHRHVFAFRHATRHSDFAPERNPMLALMAAATSAFPGAFPAVSIDTVQRALRGAWPDTSTFERESFRLHHLADIPPRDVHMIDGGLLDNFPFRHAIEAITRMPAASEVKRSLVYIEPDPALRTERARPRPGWIRTMLSALTLPHHEPIVEDLLEVRAFNARLRGLDRLVSLSEEEVSRVFQGARPDLGAPDVRLDEWRQRVHELLEQRRDPGYPGYLQLKQYSAVAQLAGIVSEICVFPPESNHAAFVREVFYRWAEDAGVLNVTVPLTDEQISFLRSFDLAYADRRLRFLIRLLNQMYGEQRDGRPDRADLNRAKHALNRQIARLRLATAPAGIGSTGCREVLELFPDRALMPYAMGEHTAEDFLAEYGGDVHKARLALGERLDTTLAGFTQHLYEVLERITTGWMPQARARLLGRYLEFPLWDAIVFPVRSFADLGETQPIRVVRMSPEEAVVPGALSAKDKLTGTKMLHFGAFLDRRGRERDFVWGRIDGAQHLVRMLIDDAEQPLKDPDQEVQSIGRRLCDAILVDERALRGARQVKRIIDRASATAP